MTTPAFYELYRKSRYDMRPPRRRGEVVRGDSTWANGYVRLGSIGFALTDTLDDLISEHRMDPQLAMKIIANFDRSIAEQLQEKVKARLTFKVRALRPRGVLRSVPAAPGAPVLAPALRLPRGPAALRPPASLRLCAS